MEEPTWVAETSVMYESVRCINVFQSNIRLLSFKLFRIQHLIISHDYSIIHKSQNLGGGLKLPKHP